MAAASRVEASTQPWLLIAMIYWLGKGRQDALMTLTAMLSALATVLATALADTPPTSTNTNDSFKALLNSLNLTEQVAATKGALTIVVLFVALIVSRFLAHRASRVPVPLESWTVRNGKLATRVLEREGGAGLLLGRLTGLCVWVAALVALAFIWLSDLNITPDNQKRLLGWLSDIGIRLGISLIVFACSLGIGGVAQRTFVAGLNRSRLNNNLKLLGGRMTYLTVVVVGIIVILAIWGTGIVLPVALLGALSVALSLALQDVLKNLVAGIYLLIEHPFVIHDRISVATFTGQIKDIQIRYTSLVTDEGEVVLIPNSILFSSAVVNLSEADRKRGALTISVPARIGAELDRTEENIREALREVQGVLQDPEPRVLLSKAANGTMEIQVTFWIAREDTGQSAAIYADVMEQIRGRVKDAEIAVLDPAASAAV